MVIERTIKELTLALLGATSKSVILPICDSAMDRSSVILTGNEAATTLQDGTPYPRLNIVKQVLLGSYYAPAVHDKTCCPAQQMHLAQFADYNTSVSPCLGLAQVGPTCDLLLLLWGGSTPSSRGSAFCIGSAAAGALPGAAAEAPPGAEAEALPGAGAQPLPDTRRRDAQGAGDHTFLNISQHNMYLIIQNQH
jgi:hypothetical protein